MKAKNLKKAMLAMLLGSAMAAPSQAWQVLSQSSGSESGGGFSGYSPSGGGGGSTYYDPNDGWGNGVVFTTTVTGAQAGTSCQRADGCNEGDMTYMGSVQIAGGGNPIPTAVILAVNAANLANSAASSGVRGGMGGLTGLLGNAARNLGSQTYITMVDAQNWMKFMGYNAQNIYDQRIGPVMQNGNFWETFWP